MSTQGRYSTPPPLRTPPPEPAPAPQAAAAPPSARRIIRLALLLALLALLLWLGLKAWRVTQAVRSLLAIQQQAQVLAAEGWQTMNPDAAEALVLRARGDIVTLHDELGFTRPIAPFLGWIPRFGPLLVASPYLLDMADAGSEAGVLAVSALKPALATVQSADFGMNRIGDLLPALQAAAPSLETAGLALERYARARDALAGAVPAENLPWRVQQLLALSDPWLPIVRDGLRLAPYLPELLGANGPRRYLIMAQNEDEMRATGGFLTGAGVLTLDSGRIADLSFMDANHVDNWAVRSYDFPPQPYYDFMGLDMLLFRDANFWPNFPTSAQKAMDLYAYGQDAPPLDGAIAVDQEFFRLLVEATGPVPIPGSDRTINAGNLLETLRQARNIREGQSVIDWVQNRKAFLGGFALAIRAKLETDFSDVDLVKLAQNMAGAAEGRHLSVYMRDPGLASALAETGWDGRLPEAPPGDFVMAVDTNMGYNKANVHVERRLDYAVDLNPGGAATLTLHYRHSGAPHAEPCFQGVAEEYELATDYLTLADQCYWNYLRVYAPAGSQLVESSRHTVPGSTLFSGRTWDATAQVVREQPGLATFANFMLVPQGGEATAFFRYTLPQGVTEPAAEETAYRLRVYKQPGARPEPLRLAITLPAGAKLLETSLPGRVENGQVVMETTLERNLEVIVRYALP